MLARALALAPAPASVSSQLLASGSDSCPLCRYMKGWITAVPNGSLVLLDLMAEESPLWKRTQSYYGAPFIWCSE